MESPDGERLLAAYAAVAVYFLRAYLPRPRLSGVIASLLWPVSLAIALAWLSIPDDHDLHRLWRSSARGMDRRARLIEELEEARKEFEAAKRLTRGQRGCQKLQQARGRTASVRE